MDIQRLRNLTTMKLHTEIEHVYEDIEYITGEKGIMTHQLPNACKAMQPYLQCQLTDEMFWDGTYNPLHTGEVFIKPMDREDSKEMWEIYSNQPSPLFG